MGCTASKERDGPTSPVKQKARHLQTPDKEIPRVKVAGVVWPPPKPSTHDAAVEDEGGRIAEVERKRKFKEQLNAKLAFGSPLSSPMSSPRSSQHIMSHTRTTSYREAATNGHAHHHHGGATRSSEASTADNADDDNDDDDDEGEINDADDDDDDNREDGESDAGVDDDGADEGDVDEAIAEGDGGDDRSDALTPIDNAALGFFNDVEASAAATGTSGNSAGGSSAAPTDGASTDSAGDDAARRLKMEEDKNRLRNQLLSAAKSLPQMDDGDSSDGESKRGSSGSDSSKRVASKRQVARQERKDQLTALPADQDSSDED